MAQFPRLSNREWDVLKLLLQGKSNKLIASSLSISARTVEFHLKNIYAKYQVSSRIELILKLGNATGKFESEKLGHSTVVGNGESTENRDRFNLRMNWATSFRDTVSIIGKELEMKNLLSSKHVLAGMITALFTGFVWVSVLLYSHSLSANEIKLGIAPLIVIWAIIGLSIGLVGKRNGNTLFKVFSSTLIGTGLSPFAIIPLMFIVVLPVGKLAEWFGFIDPSTMPKDVATTLGMTAMIGLWLIVGITVGIVLLFVTIKKPEQKIIQPHVSEHGL
jgi:DNA-binding CsgD family transcriptional regulator